MLYELALRDVTWRPSDTMNGFGWSEADLADTIKSLHRIGLFTESASTPSGWIALPPQNALNDLLDGARFQVIQFYEEMSRAWEGILDVFTEFKTTYMGQLEDSRIKIVEDPEEILATLERELRGASTEILVQGSGHGFAEPMSPVCVSLLGRGVALRCVTRSSITRLPQTAGRLRELTAHGAEARTYPTLPLSFALIDRSSGLFYAPPHRLTDDENVVPRLVIVRNPVVIEVLRSVFEHYWTQSSPLVFQPPRETEPKEAGSERAAVAAERTSSLQAGGTGRPRDKRQIALLRMLASGLTDQAIARQLGVHERTVRRKVADLAAGLQATSRFQAGVNAARAGWLDDPVDEPSDLPTQGDVSSQHAPRAGQ